MKITKEQFEDFKHSIFKFVEAEEDIPAGRVLALTDSGTKARLMTNKDYMHKGAVSHEDIKQGSIGLVRCGDGVNY